jgi:hypothetical protein
MRGIVAIVMVLALFVARQLSVEKIAVLWDPRCAPVFRRACVCQREKSLRTFYRAQFV